MVARASVRVAVSALFLALGGLSSPLAAADPPAPDDPSPAPVAESALVSASAQVSEALPTAGAAAATVPAAPEGVPHLPSPDNLPPGTTQAEPEHRRLGYLREIWQAVRSEDVTMGDALLLIAQRPLDSVPKGMTPQQGAPEAPASVTAPAPDAPLSEAAVSPEPAAPDS